MMKKSVGPSWSSRKSSLTMFLPLISVIQSMIRSLSWSLEISSFFASEDVIKRISLVKKSIFRPQHFMNSNFYSFGRSFHWFSTSWLFNTRIDQSVRPITLIKNTTKSRNCHNYCIPKRRRRTIWQAMVWVQRYEPLPFGDSLSPNTCYSAIYTQCFRRACFKRHSRSFYR